MLSFVKILVEKDVACYHTLKYILQSKAGYTLYPQGPRQSFRIMLKLSSHISLCDVVNLLIICA